MRTAEIERLSAAEARAAEAPETANSNTRLLLSSFHAVLSVFKPLTQGTRRQPFLILK